MPQNPPHHVAESDVLAVLAGTPVTRVAAQIPMHPHDLAEAVELYRAAGRAALTAQPTARSWHQVRIQFTNWSTAERAAANNLAPRLHQLHQEGTLTNWWFLRKHPCWRLRWQTTTTDIASTVSAVLDTLVRKGTIQRWRASSLYEPETLAFGGPRGIEIAHTLFHTDSHAALAYLRAETPTATGGHRVGRRELSLLLCTTLFRSAQQDEYEQGDIWHRVAQMRPLSEPAPTDKLYAMIPNIQQLTQLDTSPTSMLFDTGGPLTFAAPWSTAFAAAGQHLAEAAQEGTLERGLRDVLAHHVLFHWNRLGITTRAQAVLARAARETLMNSTTATKTAHRSVN